MPKGIDSFKEWFKDYRDHYVIIGGTACELLMSDNGLSFRATKDLDVVLLVEALDISFVKHFGEYIKIAGYEHWNKSKGKPEFYRFTSPTSDEYPFMIELFSRKPDILTLNSDAILTPIPIDEDISSLSAILLDNDYYNFLSNGKVSIFDIIILDALYLIPFKAKAWLDLSERKTRGEHIDSKNIRKHKNDVFRLTQLLSKEQKPIILPEKIYSDMKVFLEKMSTEIIDLKQLDIIGKTKEEILDELSMLYLSQR